MIGPTHQAMICGMPSWLRWRLSRPRWMLRCPVSGQQLGISQMQVSRLLGRALGYLRPRLLGLDEATLR